MNFCRTAVSQCELSKTSKPRLEKLTLSPSHLLTFPSTHILLSTVNHRNMFANPLPQTLAASANPRVHDSAHVNPLACQSGARLTRTGFHRLRILEKLEYMATDDVLINFVRYLAGLQSRPATRPQLKDAYARYRSVHPMWYEPSLITYFLAVNSRVLERDGQTIQYLPALDEYRVDVSAANTQVQASGMVMSASSHALLYDSKRNSKETKTALLSLRFNRTSQRRLALPKIPPT